VRRKSHRWPAVLWLRRYWFLSLLWEPRDLWVGVYWTRCEGMYEAGWGWSYALDVYVCVLPCIPLRVAVRQQRPNAANGAMTANA
jgi:hypothetical protein